MAYSLINSPSSPLTSANQICSDRESSPVLSLALQVRPGDDVMLMFQENGHVTLQQQDKDNLGKLGPGEVFVYGTQDSQSSDALVNIHNVWTPNGSGGDRRGFLLGEGGFDDGRCYQNQQLSDVGSASSRVPSSSPGSSEGRYLVQSEHHSAASCCLLISCPLLIFCFLLPISLSSPILPSFHPHRGPLPVQYLPLSSHPDIGSE